jgi:hypothetical protein
MFQTSCEALEACWRRLDPVCDQICAAVAVTPAKRHLQMLVMTTQIGDDPAELWQ